MKIVAFPCRASSRAVFGWVPKSIVAVEELEQIGLVVDVALIEAGPSAASGQKHPDAIGYCIEMEVWKLVDPERCICYGLCQDAPFVGVADKDDKKTDDHNGL